MANPCSSRYAFFADDKNKGELLRFYNKLSGIINPVLKTKNSADPGWLGNVVIAHGLDLETHSCRGTIEDLGEYEPDSNFFTLDSETAWTPMEKLWEAVVAQYKGVSFYYIAEEAGSDIYINTDVEGTYIPDKYMLEIWGDCHIPEGWYAKQKKPACLDIREYFSSLDNFLKYCADFTGEKFDTFEEWQNYFFRIFGMVGNVIVGVREFTAD